MKQDEQHRSEVRARMGAQIEGMLFASKQFGCTYFQVQVPCGSTQMDRNLIEKATRRLRLREEVASARFTEPDDGFTTIAVRLVHNKRPRRP
ncbi:MAG TPA: hypothetical protein VNI82_00775 [Candidatus Nitrosotenuis sp.]|nr:hypothetical protein [Candidatus Nitrosotenuis sp.]